jgi:hypothetical protein
MTNKPDGGPAFPVPAHAFQDGRMGMSLRDYFASLAMQGVLASDIDAPLDKLVAAAYEMADAMLAEREK